MSSLNFPIAATSSLLGRMPASESLLALTSIMNRIVGSPSGLGFGARPPDGLDRLNPGSTYASNEGRRDRQVEHHFPEVFVPAGRTGASAGISRSTAASTSAGLRRVRTRSGRKTQRTVPPPSTRMVVGAAV